jgi:hypothetical protein
VDTERLSRWAPRDNGDPVTSATKVALKSLAERVQLLETQIKQIRTLLRPSTMLPLLACSTSTESESTSPPFCW